MDYAVGKVLALLVFMTFVVREFWFARRTHIGREQESPNPWYYMAICVLVVTLSQLP